MDGSCDRFSAVIFSCIVWLRVQQLRLDAYCLISVMADCVEA